MGNRHAYLIIAHNQFELLKSLVECLDHPQHDFYIHIDGKVSDFDAGHFADLTKHSSVTFTRRICVVWGGFSQIETELTLLKAAVSGKYDYYHLLSGVDLPLRSAQEIYDFFTQNQGKEFIHYCTPEFCQGDGVRNRVRYHHFLQEKVGRSDGLLAKVKKGLLKAQKMLGVDRLKGKPFEVKCGANWFSITHALAEYVLSRENWIRQVFRNSFCADEVFLQTLVWNSEFRQNLYLPNEESDYHSCLRYIDWTRGAPYVFQNEDYEELIASDYLFARKFDIVKDRLVCERIVKHVLGKE